MSPQSRRRQVGASAPPNALFDELLHAARELLAVRSPLDAELLVSDLLGTWWPQRHHTIGGAGIEQLIGEGLVGYAAQRRSPAALALLSGIACLGTPRQAAAAEQAAISLIDAGVRAPRWAEHLGAVSSAECYVNPDAWGDQDEVICVYSYAGEEPHALISVIDYNLAGMLRDGWVSSQVDKLLDHCRRPAVHRVSPRPEEGFRQIDPPQARKMLQAALVATDAAEDPPVSDTFAARHAFIRSRIRALPPAPGRTGRPKRPYWSTERRALLAAEFLASDEAEELSDLQAASRIADLIIDFGCDQDSGRPLRMSPAKVQNFMLSWLPRKVLLSVADQNAMPHAVDAWIRWSGQKRGLADTSVGQTLDVLFDSMTTFSRIYRDPAEFGLDEKLVARLLPDSDLEALPRRAFAFPILEGKHGGVDLSKLDPADPADRRLLLAADHDTRTGSPSAAGVGRHIDRHLALADRLWRGSPPALWDAAQRLLDTGEDRHMVLHALMDVLDAAGTDEAALKIALRELATGLSDDDLNGLTNPDS
ncbi:MAG TPA: hypothetical protein VHZ03_30745 [Trebonia sp.]|nr:hypothetical protein [Trebonia sp.]